MKGICILLVLIGLSGAVDWSVVTELDAYVAEPESVFGYEIIDIERVPGATIHILNLTTLTYFDETLTTTPVWWHYFVVVIPDVLNYNDAALLDIAYGPNDNSAPTCKSSEVEHLLNFSLNTGAVTAMITQVPNQPLYFVDETIKLNKTRPRVEDEIIAYTWKLFIEENVTDPSVNLLFPMTKSAKLAVDALVEYTTSVDPFIQITQVLPTGLSKRGWTTWLLGCVDQRVFAMVPVVFDLLNFYVNLQSHYTSLGGWSFALAAYFAVGVPRYLHHPNTRVLMADIDPLEYNERLTMPKHLHGATGDEFFLQDNAYSWYKNITQEFHHTIFENDNHPIYQHRPQLWSNIENLFLSVKGGIPRPQYTFTKTVDVAHRTGTIRLESVTIPSYVKIWVADNTNRTCEPDDDVTGTCRRDFRLYRFNDPHETLIKHLEDTPTDLGNGAYEITYPYRDDFGFRTFHMEVGYPGQGGRTMIVTSETCILPDIKPFPICVTEEECQGQLK